MLSTALVLLILVVVLALVFDFINGFHDTANAIATVVSTRVLTPRQAILMASILNLIGALTGTGVAKTLAKEIVTPSSVSQEMVIAALIGAILWNLLTWYFGIPSSSTHALIGGLLGAVFVGGKAAYLHGDGILKMSEYLVLTPIVAFVVGYITMLALYWFVALFKMPPAGVNRHFRKLQLVSSAWMAFSHGQNDAQKTMGIITMALVSYGAQTSVDVPIWVMVICAVAMALGTSAGGWRVMRTMGQKIIKLQPISGFATEMATAVVITTVSIFFHMLLSTTHVKSGAIMGVGASRRLSAVKWGIAGSIGIAWVLTVPASAIMAGIALVILQTVV